MKKKLTSHDWIGLVCVFRMSLNRDRQDIAQIIRGSQDNENERTVIEILVLKIK